MALLATGLAFLLTAPAACGSDKDKEKHKGKDKPAVALAPEAVAGADQIYLQRCANCHGPEGYGDGQAAASLNPKPRNFHDKYWQKSVDDARIEKVTVAGGQAIGKSPVMSANPDLQEKPAVLKALVAKVRSFGQ